MSRLPLLQNSREELGDEHERLPSLILIGQVATLVQLQRRASLGVGARQVHIKLTTDAQANGYESLLGLASLALR